jgi:hypothetical protein
MPLSRRYTPEIPPDEKCNIGMDFSPVIPVGVGITDGSLSIWYNTQIPTAADSDWTVTAVTVLGRVLYCNITGGVQGKDYQFRWVANDTRGNIWPRTALGLCSLTS